MFAAKVFMDTYQIVDRNQIFDTTPSCGGLITNN